MSLSKMNFINILITAVIFTLVIGAFTIKMTYDSYESRMHYMEQSYIQKNKTLVQHEVTRSIQRIRMLQQEAYQDLRKELEEKVDFASILLSQGHQDGLDQKELVQRYRSEFDQFKWDHNTGYFFMFDEKGMMLYHGSNPEFEGKTIEELSEGRPEVLHFIQQILSHDEHFGEYPWQKPNEQSYQLYDKYVYAKKVDHTGIYIAAGIYKDELKKFLIQIVLDDLEKDRFGDHQYGYFWVNDMHYHMLMHPISQELEAMDLRDFKTIDGQYLFEQMYQQLKNDGTAFLEYVWYRPDNMKPDEKITYAQLDKELGIVVASGFYLTKLKEMLTDEKVELRSVLFNNLQNILSILAVLIVISLIAARYISNRIRKIEKEQKEHLHMLEQYKMILDKSSIVSKTTPAGIITYVNKSFCEVSGYAKEEAIGQPHNIVRHPQTPKKEFKELWRTIKSGAIWEGLIKNRAKSGRSYFNRTVIAPIKDPQGNITEYISAAMDITELLENRNTIRSILNTDALTGLGNRIKLIEKLAANQTGVLGLINIDRFKEINDTFGQECGDQTIKMLAKRLFEFISDNKEYSIFRIQADEFALYSMSDTQEGMLDNIKTFMQEAGAEPYECESHHFMLTYSSGIAQGDENILAYADIALSEGRRKNQKIYVYEPQASNAEVFRDNIIWVEKIHKAIKEDRIIPYFQPIYHYPTGKIEKYECLMRMLDDDRVISPHQFLDLAKKTRLYPELTYQMVEKSINFFVSQELEFSINLSAEDLMNGELMEYLFEYALQKEVNRKMVLEIVESEEIEEYDEITRIIKRFKENGSKIAIDDFGTGYSNYDYLLSLQADFVKIDGSLTKHLLEDERTQDVVRSIVTFAKKSNMKTIAEFVSSQEISEMVRNLGVDYAQGYYYGKPGAQLIENPSQK